MKAINIIAVTSAVLCLTSAKTPIAVDESLTYECTSTTVIVTVKNATNYRSLFAEGSNANNGKEECIVTRTAQNESALFEIRGCVVAKPITIIIMQAMQTGTQHDNVIGGKHTAEYELLCNQVYLGGVTMKKTFHMTNVTDLTVDTGHHQPTFTLDMTIQNKDRQVLNTPVLIGTDILLVISGTHGFKIYPQSCVASSLANRTDHAKPLITNGLADDPAIMTNFSDQANDAKKNETDFIEAHLYAFHFQNSDTIYFECTVFVCQPDDISCQASSRSTTVIPKATSITIPTSTQLPAPAQSAATGRRKRNVADTLTHKHTVYTSLRVVDSNILNENAPGSASISMVSSFWTASTFTCLALQVARP